MATSLASSRSGRPRKAGDSRTGYGIILAAGSGRRFGGEKQFARLRGRPVLVYSADAFESSTAIAGFVVVVPGLRVTRVRRLLAGNRKLLGVTAGGARRSVSVRRGLALLPDTGIVAVHDAARPLVTPAMIDAGIVACRRRGSVAYGRRLTDTIKRVRLGRVVETIDRRDLVAIETPQFFPLSLLRRAHASGADATDDCALIERLGVTPGWIETPGPNLKVTTRADLALAGALL